MDLCLNRVLLSFGECFDGVLCVKDSDRLLESTLHNLLLIALGLNGRVFQCVRLMIVFCCWN